MSTRIIDYHLKGCVEEEIQKSRVQKVTWELDSYNSSRALTKMGGVNIEQLPRRFAICEAPRPKGGALKPEF